MNPAILPWPKSLHVSAAVGEVARALYRAHHATEDPVTDWDDLQPQIQQNYCKHAVMTLERIQREAK